MDFRELTGIEATNILRPWRLCVGVLILLLAPLLATLQWLEFMPS